MQCLCLSCDRSPFWHCWSATSFLVCFGWVWTLNCCLQLYLFLLLLSVTFILTGCRETDFRFKQRLLCLNIHRFILYFFYSFTFFQFFMSGFGISVCVNNGAPCNEPQKLVPLLTIFQGNCIQWCRLQIQYLINEADGLKQEEIINLTP